MTTPDYKGFAIAIMGDWPEVGGLDGFDLQQLAEKYGLLRKEIRTVPCVEDACNCAEYVMHGEEAECYIPTWTEDIL